jgi:predicted alpha-1,6-mannanase (GH76 family)
MIFRFRFHRRALSTVKKWWAIAAMLLTGSGAAAFTTNDAATIFNAFNTAFMSNGAYSGWWTGAELLEMAQDAYDNSPTVARRNIVTSTCNGFLSQHGSNWMYNEYNDDIAWAVIAFSRAHQITGNTTYRNVAQSNFDGMFARGWDTNFFGGGIWWRQSDRQSKNACIQGPAAIAACYLYNITGNIGYLQKAQAIHAWNRAVLFNPTNGSVYDNIGTNGVVDTVALTYNQGTFIGAANFLYRATGLPSYYQDAILAGKRAQNNMTTAGILPQWSSNTDLSGFNGIFARWMARFAKDQNLWASFGPWLGTNANAAWSVRNTNDLAWQKWRTPTPNSGSEIGNWGCSAAVVIMQVADPGPADALRVTPTAGFTAVAQQAQLPGATSVNLILTNTSASPLNWSLGNTSAWLNVSVSSGTLPAFGATLVNVSLVPAATTNFPAGRYFANVALTNSGSGMVAQRIFTLALSGGAAPILMTGHNATVLAPNTATAGVPGATGFDIPNSYSFYQAGLSGSTRGLPPDGVFTSQWDKQTVFQFRPYGSLNTLLLGYTYPNSATLTLTIPRAYQSLTILASSAHGSGSGTFVLNFTNGTQSPVFSFNAQDWFGTTANVAITALGRLKLGGGFGPEDNGAANPNMYQTTINLAALGLDQEIASVTFTKPAGASAQQITGIFAVSGIVAYREPVITQQPAPGQLFRFVGASNSWSVTANAAQPLTYQWRLNSVAIPEATNATYQVANLQTNRSGNYTVVFSNVFGVVTSSVAALTVAPAPTYPFGQAVLAAGPLGYWRLDELNGTVARDYVSTNNGTYSNVQLGQPGHRLVDTHTSARFGLLAANNSCVTNINLDFAAGNNSVFSVEAWVNGGSQSSDAGLVAKGYGSGGEQFNLDCGGPGRAFRFFVRERYGTARLATSSVVPNNQWYHLVAVCDQANGFVRLYVNGNQAAQGSITPNVGLLPSLAPVSIGSRQAGLGSAYNNQFSGFMQEVAIYGYALSAAQVLAHYQTATNRAPIFHNNPFTVASANAGQSYVGNLAAYVSEPNGDAMTFAKLGGPAWLNLTSGGIFSGTPLSAQVGTNTFIVRATDASGLASSATLNLVVLTAPPILLNANSQAGGLLLSWTGGIAPYQVQLTTNLTNPDWQNLGTSSGGSSLLVPPTNPAAYFRVYGQ